MGITSVALQILVSALAVGALTATAWVWPRLAGRHWSAVLGRMAALLGNQMLTLAALALAANSYFGFYASWTDVLGTDTSTALITPAGLAAGVRVLGSRQVPGGRIDQVLMPGPATHLSEQAYVFLPAAYFKDRRRRFPAILALTGYPGDPRNLMTRLDLPGRMARAIAGHQVPPTVVVMMRPSAALPRDTECVDVPGGPQALSYLAAVVEQDITAAYRVGAGHGFWGVLGGSTGGYCALKIAMSRPEAFSAAVSLSGYYKTIVDGTTGDLFGGDQALERRNDLMWRLTRLPAPPIGRYA